MTEIQWYLVNGLIGALALMAFYTFRSWYNGLSHEYKMYSLEHEAEQARNRLRSLLSSVSEYEIERLRKTLKEFGSTLDLQQQITWFRDQRIQDREEIKKLADKVEFLWRNTRGE